MKYDSNGDLVISFGNVVTGVAYLWLFASVVAGIIRTVQYLYAHLQWI